MTIHSYNLAIETSGRIGSITLGDGENILTTRQLEQRARHTISLMPTLDTICKERNIKPFDINQIYVALGPGSFTGLRVALATVKMLALVNPNLKVIGVPSLNAIAQNTPKQFNSSAVCLNLKRQTVHSALFKRSADGAMEQTSEAKLRTLDEILELAPRPLALIGDPLPEQAANLEDDSVNCFTGELAKANSESLWHLGRKLAKENKFDDAQKLEPLYIREPEAVILWNQKEAAGDRL